MTVGFTKRPECPFCLAERLSVNTDIEARTWSLDEENFFEAVARVTIICDGCHKTIYDQEHRG